VGNDLPQRGVSRMSEEVASDHLPIPSAQPTVNLNVCGRIGRVQTPGKSWSPRTEIMHVSARTRTGGLGQERWIEGREGLGKTTGCWQVQIH